MVEYKLWSVTPPNRYMCICLYVYIYVFNASAVYLYLCISCNLMTHLLSHMVSNSTFITCAYLNDLYHLMDDLISKNDLLVRPHLYDSPSFCLGSASALGIYWFQMLFIQLSVTRRSFAVFLSCLKDLVSLFAVAISILRVHCEVLQNQDRIVGGVGETVMQLVAGAFLLVDNSWNHFLLLRCHRESSPTAYSNEWWHLMLSIPSLLVSQSFS